MLFKMEIEPAKWYQFWRVNSGVIGGFIYGSIIGLLIVLAMKLYLYFSIASA